MSVNLYTMLIIAIPIIVFSVVTFLVDLILDDFGTAIFCGIILCFVAFSVTAITLENNINPSSTQELQVVSCSVTNDEMFLETEDGENRTYNINQITFIETNDNKTYVVIKEYSSLALFDDITIKTSKENIAKIKGAREIDL